MKYLRVCCCIGLFLVASKWRVLGQEEITTNSWTKGSGGKWEEVSAWSLGRLPNATQAVSIESENEKTVVIDAATAQQFPSSLSIHNLVLSNSNTLKLDRVGSAGALQLNAGTNRWVGLEVLAGAKLINLDSEIQLDGYLRVIGGGITQGGGIFAAEQSTVIASGGSYILTNGLFEGAQIELPSSGMFTQYGGKTRFLDGIRVNSGSRFELTDGELLSGGSVTVNNNSTFVQSGGLIETVGMVVGAPIEGKAVYVLDGGILRADNVNVAAGMSQASFEINGGTHIVTNSLRLRGSARYHPPIGIPASYRIRPDGSLVAGSLEIDSSVGFCSFVSSGEVQVKENLSFIGDAYHPAEFRISGGNVAASNLVVESGMVDIHQEHGDLIVSNTFVFGGYYPGFPNGWPPRRAEYSFLSGRFSAKDIELSADWVIWNSPAGARIHHSGTFRMAGTLRVANAIEQFGRFILVSNATINLDLGNAKISFGRSDAEEWSDSMLLSIINWSGSTNGGGNDQLRFGNNGNGLSAEQLRQIEFVDPVGLPSGVYRAEMLETGEVVPMLTQRVFHTTRPGGLVLTWQGTGVLQSSTNVAGPYENVPSATSPHNIEEFPGVQRFFRVLE